LILEDVSGVVTLRDRENETYQRSWKEAIAHKQIRPVLTLIDDAVDFMVNVALHPPNLEADSQAISAIAARIFNTTAGALREALNGYSQTSFSLQRDLIEMHTLLDVFSHDLKLIARWRVVTNRERKREFSPAKLREILKQRDGKELDEHRYKEYELFCENAAHLTYPALRLLALDDGSTAVGPMGNFKHVGNCLFELGKHVLNATRAETRVMTSQITKR
jgi:hypothetical protein